jgi:hypothetical protein
MADGIERQGQKTKFVCDILADQASGMLHLVGSTPITGAMLATIMQRRTRLEQMKTRMRRLRQKGDNQDDGNELPKHGRIVAGLNAMRKREQFVLDGNGDLIQVGPKLPPSAPIGLNVWLQGLEISWNNGLHLNKTNGLLLPIGSN